jgi:hypothetical protein
MRPFGSLGRQGMVMDGQSIHLVMKFGDLTIFVGLWMVYGWLTDIARVYGWFMVDT